MDRTVSVSGIGERLVTFKIDATTQAYIKANLIPDGHTYASIPDHGIAVRLVGDLTVGLGTTAAGAATDALFGILKTYDGDNVAGIQVEGYATGVPTKAAVAVGASVFVVTNDGKLAAGTEATPKNAGLAVKAATASDLFVDIKL